MSLSRVTGAVEKKRRVTPQTVEITGLLAATLGQFVAKLVAKVKLAAKYETARWPLPTREPAGQPHPS